MYVIIHYANENYRTDLNSAQNMFWGYARELNQEAAKTTAFNDPM